MGRTYVSKQKRSSDRVHSTSEIFIRIVVARSERAAPKLLSGPSRVGGFFLAFFSSYIRVSLPSKRSDRSSDQCSSPHDAGDNYLVPTRHATFDASHLSSLLRGSHP